MQSLMGLTKEMSKNFMIKVFADYQKIIKNLIKKLIFQLRELEELNSLEKLEKLN